MVDDDDDDVGGSQLDGLEKSFYSFYICTAVRKFFFFLDPLRTGRVRIQDILACSFLDDLLEVCVRARAHVRVCVHLCLSILVAICSKCVCVCVCAHLCLSILVAVQALGCKNRPAPFHGRMS